MLRNNPFTFLRPVCLFLNMTVSIQNKYEKKQIHVKKQPNIVY